MNEKAIAPLSVFLFIFHEKRKHLQNMFLGECVVIVLISVNDTTLNRVYESLKKRNKILSELDKFENSSENNRNLIQIMQKK